MRMAVAVQPKKKWKQGAGKQRGAGGRSSGANSIQRFFK
jgi:hypothetical protein